MTIAQRTVDNGSGTDYTAHVDNVTIASNAGDIQPVFLAPRCEHTWYDLVTQASAVAALDQLCDEVELTGMALNANGCGMLHNALLVSNNLTVISAELWLYQVNPTAAGTNNVHNQTDANNETSRPLGAIQFLSWYAETDNMWSYGTYAGFPLTTAFGLPYECEDGTNTTSIWGILMTRTAVTPGATTDYNLAVWHTRESDVARIYNPARVDMVLWDGSDTAFLEIRQKLIDNKTVCRGAYLLAVIVVRPPEEVGTPENPVRDAHGIPVDPEAVVRCRLGEWAVFDPSTPLEVEFLRQEQVDRRYPEPPVR